MCDQMGIEPDEEEIPLDISDFTYTLQSALLLFQILPDKVEGMGGTWLGKEFAGLADIMDIYQIEDRKEVFEYLLICIEEARKYYSEQQKIRETQIKR